MGAEGWFPHDGREGVIAPLRIEGREDYAA